MKRHFHQELKELKQQLSEMGKRVQAAIVKSCDAVLKRDESLAKAVLEEENRINELEIEIDEKGHTLFATGQPMAVDLRMITMILKINTDLERMGDHAVNLAVKSRYIVKEPDIHMNENVSKMVYVVEAMLKDALDSFLREDVNLAKQVLKRDDEVDDYHANCYNQLRQIMQKDSKTVGAGISFLMVSHNLERIADLACNIAEDVIYLKQGKEVRHSFESHDS